jgi:hypothetical protein
VVNALKGRSLNKNLKQTADSSGFFEGLKSIGNKYVLIQGYEAFGRYCLLKKQGLKKQAVAAVKEF